MNVNTGEIRRAKLNEMLGEDEIPLSEHEAAYLEGVKPENRMGVLSGMADDLDARIEAMRKDRRPEKPRRR